jgi:hypothetical protein
MILRKELETLTEESAAFANRVGCPGGLGAAISDARRAARTGCKVEVALMRLVEEVEEWLNEVEPSPLSGSLARARALLRGKGERP